MFFAGLIVMVLDPSVALLIPSTVWDWENYENAIHRKLQVVMPATWQRCKAPPVQGATWGWPLEGIESTQIWL